jgi:hypothetical protein
MQVRTRNGEIQPFSDFITHSALRSSQHSLYELLERNNDFPLQDIVDGTATLFLVQAMSYTANEESGMGSGHIYSTMLFNSTKKPRHDFVEVAVKEDGKDEPSSVLGQVVTFLEVRRDNESDYYAVLQYLEEVKEVRRGRVAAERVFKKYRWEPDGYKRGTRVQLYGIVEFASISGPAYVVPDFAAVGASNYGGLRHDYDIKPRPEDRFFHVPRTFTDRSGYQAEIINQQWRNDNQDAGDNLMDWLRDNQTSNRGLEEPPRDRGGVRDYDINIDIADILELEGSDSEVDEEHEFDAEDAGGRISDDDGMDEGLLANFNLQLG